MGIKIQQQEVKVDKKQWQKSVADLEKNEAWRMIKERIADLRNEAHTHLMMLSQEPIGRGWRERMHAFDEVLGISDDILAESLEAERQDRLR